MISKSLSTSEKFASLHHIAGRLGEFCQSLYPLLVIHADDWGRLPGDVFTVKHLVHPTSPRSLTHFDTALQALHNAGLIAWYQIEDKWYIQIRDFGKHQDLKGHDKDGRKPAIPAPPENLKDFAFGGNSPPNSPKLPLREEKRTKENLIRTVADATAEGEAENQTVSQNAEVGPFIRRFCEIYTQYRHGARYFVKRQKDVPLVRQLLAVYPRERLEKLAVVLLTTDDEWIAATDRGIGILSIKASWLDGLLAGYEAKHGTIQVA